MAKLQPWTVEQAKSILQKRLKTASQSKLPLTERWRENERTLFDTDGSLQNGTGTSLSAGIDGSISGSGGAGGDHAEGEARINYVFKNFKLIHAQLASNPPAVAPQPTSSDPADRRKASAADKILRHAMRAHSMQEHIDLVSQDTLVYGSGFLKTYWNPLKGEPIDRDPDTGEYVFEGDYDQYIPSVWDMFLDPDAEQWSKVKWVFERFRMDWEEIAAKYPEHLELLNRYRINNEAGGSSPSYSSSTQSAQESELRTPNFDVIELYEYWEAGNITNGYLGRKIVCTIDGDPIGGIQVSPEAYGQIRGSTETLPVAVLPYHIFTDIDIPHQVWGKSFIDYTVAIQDTLNATDDLALLNLQAHGTARLLLPDGAEIADDSITQSPIDIIKVSGGGGQLPTLLNPLPMPQAIEFLMNRYAQGINDMAGTNESMFGQQSREQSGHAMQYATNQGNLIRKRLFNKYVGLVEAVYVRYLQIIQNNWDTPRTIQVLGKNKAFETLDVQGSDIKGGFDIQIKYGTHLSLDPTVRRQEMMTFMPLLEKAGVSPRKLLQSMALTDLEGELDDLSLAEDRQRELFDEMIGSGIYKAPDKLQDHANMLVYCSKYVMSPEYKYLEEEDRVLINKHIEARMALSQELQGSIGSTNPPGPAPQGPGPGMPPGGPPQAPPAVS